MPLTESWISQEISAIVSKLERDYFLSTEKRKELEEELEDLKRKRENLETVNNGNREKPSESDHKLANSKRIPVS